MATAFYDFELGIWKDVAQYKAEVKDSPAGSCGRSKFHWPFKEDHHSLLRDLEIAVMRTHDYRGPFMSAEEGQLRDFGSAVFNAVFGVPRIRTLYEDSLGMAQRDGRTLRLKLRVDPPELAILPWEYVYDSVRTKQFVCLDRDHALVRFYAGGRPRPMPAGRRLRILVMISDPTGSGLDTEAERNSIDRAFRKVSGESHECRWVQGESVDDLRDALREGPWDIFHFIGHGGLDTVADAANQKHAVGYLLMRPGKNVLLQNPAAREEKVYPSRLSAMLRMAEVRLAVLNCCDSGRGVGISSLAATLVQATVPLAVGMQFPISNSAALEFSDQFYRVLANGSSVEHALRKAREAIAASCGLEWGSPVLFTHSEAEPMFDVMGTGPAPAAESAPPELSAAERQFRDLWGR